MGYMAMRDGDPVSTVAIFDFLPEVPLNQQWEYSKNSHDASKDLNDRF